MLVPRAGAQTAPSDDHPVTWKRVIPDIADDQRRIWTSPFRMVRGSHLVPTLSVLAVTAGLVALDPHTAPYFRRTTSFQSFNSGVSGRNTNIGIILAPASLYVAGLIRKDSYGKSTALLAGEAVADSEVVALVLKCATNRTRPGDLPAAGHFSDTWFESKSSWVRGHGSFPSGHTIAAFSVATVIARRYPHHRWVPYVSYGLAALVGFSRVTTSAHFPADVFMGAALGYSIARFTTVARVDR